MKELLRLCLPVLALVLFATPGFAQRTRLEGAGAEKHVTQTFNGISEIEIKTVSGDCVVTRGGGAVQVDVVYTYSDSSFEPTFEQQGDRLVLRENFLTSTSGGRSAWGLSVPDGIRLSFSTASGDFEMDELQADIEVKTASGDIRLSAVAGELDVSTASGDIDADGLLGRIDLSTASGDVDLRNSEGEFKVSSASGDVEANGVVLAAASRFSAASGDVDVSLGQTASYGLKISSASGDAALNLNSYPIQGTLEMTTREGNQMYSPYTFDREEISSRWGNEFVKRTLVRGEGPRIEISSASGRAILKEN